MSKIPTALLIQCIKDISVNQDVIRHLESVENNSNFTIKQIISLIERDDHEQCVIKIILDFTDLNGKNQNVPNILATYTWNKLTKEIHYLQMNNETSESHSKKIGMFLNN